MTTDDYNTERDTNSAVSGIHLEWEENERPSTVIVECVAAVVGRQPTELTPLYESIEPDALNGLIRPATPKAGDPIRISFQYEEVDVLVDSQTGIEIYPEPSDEESSVDSNG